MAVMARTRGGCRLTPRTRSSSAPKSSIVTFCHRLHHSLRFQGEFSASHSAQLAHMLTAVVRAEMKALVTIAAPIILSFLLLMSIGLISVLNVGHIGENELAAVGFSVTFLNILGNSWLVGMVSALDTFGTQAFGAKNFVMFSNVMQRSLFLCMATCIPLFVLFMFNDALLDAFRYDVTVRDLAAPCAPPHPPAAAFLL
jgi:Na+-driven multidrug efflux pump